MTTLGENGKFVQQLQWRPAALGPTQMLSVQRIAVQMAIAEVNESIKRVEGKVESVLKLVDANRRVGGKRC